MLLAGLTPPRTVIVLLETDQYIAIIEAMASLIDSAWNLMTISYLPLTLPAEPATEVLSLTSTPSTGDPIHLTGVTSCQDLSLGVYFWGSHVLYSPDGGRSVFQVEGPGPDDPTQSLITHSFRLVAAITLSHHVWAGVVGEGTLHQVFPSPAWSTTLFLNSHPSVNLLHPANIVTAFFDKGGLLTMLYTDTSTADLSLSRVVVSLVEVFRHMSIRDSWLASLRRGTSFQAVGTCPYQKVDLSVASQYLSHTARQITMMSAPLLIHALYDPSLHTAQSLAAWASLVHHLRPLAQADLDSVVTAYRDPYVKWKSLLGDAREYHRHLFRGGLLEGGLQADLDSYHRTYNGHGHLRALPPLVFLDYMSLFAFEIEVTHATHPTINIARDTYLHVTLSNVDAIVIDVRKSIDFSKKCITFYVIIKESGTLYLFKEPGYGLVPAAAQFIVSNAATVCFPDATDEHGNNKLTGIYNTNILIGCPPAQKVQFDYNATLTKMNASGMNSIAFETLDAKFPRFSFDEVFSPVFKVFNSAYGEWEQYHGNYTLTIIGSSETAPSSMKALRDDSASEYSPEQIIAYNHGNQIWSSVSAITVNQNIPIFNSSMNEIRWQCARSSPCIDVMPKGFRSPEIWFLVKFSNEDHNSGVTHCNYAMHFVLNIHALQFASAGLHIYILFSAIAFHSLIVGIYWCFIKIRYAKVTPTPLISHQLGGGSDADVKTEATSGSVLVRPLRLYSAERRASIESRRLSLDGRRMSGSSSERRDSRRLSADSERRESGIDSQTLLLPMGHPIFEGIKEEEDEV